MARPVILVVDDDPGVRESFRLILEDHYDVIDAADGPQALDVLRASQVDLVLLDIRLPEMDGIEVLERIKAIDDEVEVDPGHGVRRGRVANSLAGRSGTQVLLVTSARQSEELA